MKIFWTLLIVIVIVVVGFWIFSDDNDITEIIDEEMDELLEDMIDEDVDSETSEVREFHVEGFDNFSFSMNEMNVNAGDTIRVTFFNAGNMPHDIVFEGIDDASTSILSGGEEEVIEFTVSESGTYEYYCSVGNHREMGMIGTLTVN